MSGFTRLTLNGVDLTAQVAYVSLHTSLPDVDAREVSNHGYARLNCDANERATPYIPAAVWDRCVDAVSPDAMRLDASRAEADAELAEWRALLDAAKGRRG